MTSRSSRLTILPCVDSPLIAARLREQLYIPRRRAAELGRSAVTACRLGYYYTRSGSKIDWSELVRKACDAKQSIPPEAPLPEWTEPPHPETLVQVVNATTLEEGKRFVRAGLKPVALNFANGVVPGGGFLDGARAQEESLCRASALFWTLDGDPMYEYHRSRSRPDSTDWAIYSPHVPVFRDDDGREIEEPWLLSFITCAAPYAPEIGQPESGDLLQKRIHRVLAIGRAFGHQAIVLGAWGCGAFHNDPRRTAADFRRALETDFDGCFSNVAFAITDWGKNWAPQREVLGAFREVFSAGYRADPHQALSDNR